MTDEPLPEQTFFADPVVDRVLGVAMTLATEVWVLRDRVRALQILSRGMALLDGAKDDAAHAFLRTLADVLLRGRTGGGSWRLQELTDLVDRLGAKPPAPEAIQQEQDELASHVRVMSAVSLSLIAIFVALPFGVGYMLHKSLKRRRRVLGTAAPAK